jgi:hypothetical protein
MSGNRVYQDLRGYGRIIYPMPMKIASSVALLLTLFASANKGQTVSVPTDDSATTSALSYKVAHFDMKDANLVEALSKLSLEPIAGLHLGIEEIIRDKGSEVADRSVRFSLTLRDENVRDILDTLCKSDNRYTWSADGSSVNVYPREIIGSSSYLLNRELDSISLENINRPSDALNTLMKLLPGEQFGVAQVGFYNGYPESWTTSFNHLTVRQLMNRLSEHDGPRGGWIWSGFVGQRFFAYFERGFQRG